MISSPIDGLVHESLHLLLVEIHTMPFPSITFSNIHAQEQSSLVVAPQINVTSSRGPEPEPACRIKYTRDPSFIGREDVLELVEDDLREFGSVALTGPGGIGWV